MEIRKLQLTGGRTHVVSLPKKWVDRNHLGKSDAIRIHEEADGSLLLVPHQETRPPARRIQIQHDVTQGQETLTRKLIGAYLAGADEIHITGQGRMDPKVRQQIRTTIRDMVGVEILEESGATVTLQDLVGVSEMDLRKTVTRMHRIARIMFDDAMIALEERDNELAADVSSRDDELDRLEWHVSKQMHALLEQPRLAIRLQIRPAQVLNLFLAARSLERIGDHASKICKNVVDMAGAIPPEIMASLQSHQQGVCKVWEDAFAAIKRNDFDQGSKAVDDGKAISDWRPNLSQQLRGLAEETPVAHLAIIADSIDRVRGYAIDIAEIGMNQTFQHD